MTKGQQKPTLYRPATYHIKVPGVLDASWEDWVDGIMTTEGESEATLVTTLITTVDQAALQGLLRRLYGRRGFFQYQMAVPTSAAAAILECVRQINKTDQRPYLAILKAFGSRRSPGLLSFPIEGLTFALDFANRGESTLRLLERFDNVVHEAKGRVYFAKDGHMSAQMIHSTYPRIKEFARYVDTLFCSDFWRRATS